MPFQLHTLPVDPIDISDELGERLSKKFARVIRRSSMQPDLYTSLVIQMETELKAKGRRHVRKCDIRETGPGLVPLLRHALFPQYAAIKCLYLLPLWRDVAEMHADIVLVSSAGDAVFFFLGGELPITVDTVCSLCTCSGMPPPP